MTQPRKSTDSNPGIVGLLPAAVGVARSGRLPCSKEILPLIRREKGDGQVDGGATDVVSTSVLRAMSSAGIAPVHVVLDREKQDVMRYWGSGSDVDVRLSYHLIDATPSIASAIDAVYPFVRDRVVAFGFLDTVYAASGLFSRLRDQQAESESDIVLALFPARDPGREDTVNMSPEGAVRDIHVRVASSPFEWSWGAAIWTPAFTELIHATLQRIANEGYTESIPLGELMAHALRKRLKIDGVLFPEGRFNRIDTPGDWQRLVLADPYETDVSVQPPVTDSPIPTVQTTRQP